MGQIRVLCGAQSHLKACFERTRYSFVDEFRLYCISLHAEIEIMTALTSHLAGDSIAQWMLMCSLRAQN